MTLMTILTLFFIISLCHLLNIVLEYDELTDQNPNSFCHKVIRKLHYWLYDETIPHVN